MLPNGVKCAHAATDFSKELPVRLGAHRDAHSPNLRHSMALDGGMDLRTTSDAIGTTMLNEVGGGFARPIEMQIVFHKKHSICCLFGLDANTFVDRITPC